MTQNSLSSGSAAGQYEGKAKRVTVRADRCVEIFFKDDATAFNAQKHAVFAGKGALNSQISELFFTRLKAAGIANHFIKRHDARTLLCQQAQMIALEVVVRFKVAGSLAKRTGLAARSVCEPPVLEFYYKRDDLSDPIVNADHIRLLQLASPEELTALSAAGLQTALHVRDICAAANIDLVDLKLEYGRTSQGILLADEISPDTCRMHDKTTLQAFDKDLFRHDLGDLLTGYREVYRRLESSVHV